MENIQKTRKNRISKKQRMECFRSALDSKEIQLGASCYNGKKTIMVEAVVEVVAKEETEQ